MRCWKRRVAHRRDSRRARAAAVVEFAVVLPVLLTILFGIVEYGYVFMVRLTVEHAAREGCRVASLSTSTSAEVTARVAQTMNDLPYTLDPPLSNPVPCQETVTVRVAYTDVSLTGFFGNPSGDLVGTTTMRKEGCTPP
ncbi:MAG: TadE family protein [Planctomycetota bacterium]|jgi:Flp pilus assembly protein TadG